MIGASANGRAVPALGRELAARLSVLFERDVEIVKRLSDTQRRLRDANDRLWSGLSSDAFGLIYGGTAPVGESQVAGLIEGALSASGPESRAAVLGALQQIHWAVHCAFCEYQSACEERRQLAFEVGELAQQLTVALCAAGWSADEARRADVHQLAGGRVR